MIASLDVTLKRREQDLIVCIGKSAAKELIIKDCTRSVVLFKLTTDRHEASRSLSATSKLLVAQVTMTVYVHLISSTSNVWLMLADEDVLQLQRLLNRIVSVRLVPSVRSDKVRNILLLACLLVCFS